GIRRNISLARSAVGPVSAENSRAVSGRQRRSADSLQCAEWIRSARDRQHGTNAAAARPAGASATGSEIREGRTGVVHVYRADRASHARLAFAVAGGESARG